MPALNGAQFRALGARLKVAGAVGLRAELRAGIRAAAEPLVGDVRKAARADLPKAGGLAERVAESPIRVSTLLAGRNAGVRLTNRAKEATGSGKSVQFGTDTGRLRHPVFGNRKVWVTQPLAKPGWWTDTLTHEAHTVEPFVLAAMRHVSEQVCRKI